MTFEWSQLFTSELEFIGFITGILSVALLAPTMYPKLQYTNWIFSIISAAIYLFLFYDWALYGNSFLQIWFLVISIVGAYEWLPQVTGSVGGRKIKETLKARYSTQALFAQVVLTSLLTTIPVYFVLDYYNDAQPLWDGLILTLSGGAIWLQLKKYVQSWFLWIAVDLIAIPLHASQGKGATALLYFVYLLLCFWGLYTWKKEADSAQETPVPHARNTSLGEVHI